MSTSDDHDHPSPDSPPPPIITAKGSDINNGTMRDILLWRKKKLGALVLTSATAIWVALEIYQFNFLTVVSWVAMAVIALMFLWGNLLRLLGKETPKSSDFEISEESVMGMANTLRGYAEEGVRWMFRVSAESELYLFVGAVGALWLLSVVGSCFDFITFLYTGVMMGMTVPVVYVNYEDQIKRLGERTKGQLRRWYQLVDEKLFTKLKHKFGIAEEVKETKQKKVE